VFNVRMLHMLNPSFAERTLVMESLGQLGRIGAQFRANALPELRCRQGRIPAPRFCHAPRPFRRSRFKF
jgi:hypothetical protein